MPVTDPIADMLTRIRNAIMVKRSAVSMPSSKMKLSLAGVLKREGFIETFDVVKGDAPQDTIRLRLHYREDGESSIMGLKRVSKPGLRVYVGKGEIPRYYGGLGVAILSTSSGIMTGRQAWRAGVGGELLCYVW